MSGSVASVFGEPDEFQAALREDGIRNLLVTEKGQFRARLTQVRLPHLRLSAGDERLARIAFAVVPADTLLVSLRLGDRPAPIWGGQEMRAGELIALGPGERVHSRSEGPCRWGAIRLPVAELARYWRVMTETPLVIPPIACWRPPRAALRQLRHFHRAAIDTAAARSDVLADSEAAHGLEQQVIHALVASLSAGPVSQTSRQSPRHRGLLARFEQLIEAEPAIGITEIGTALGVSLRVLRECCKQGLGISPSRYRARHGMQRARRALRHENPDATSISTVARRYGFRDPGRFAASYRAFYGESPSVTLQRRFDGVNPTLAGRA
jgi:AraC-like DNA-binding protein